MKREPKRAPTQYKIQTNCFLYITLFVLREFHKVIKGTSSSRKAFFDQLEISARSYERFRNGDPVFFKGLYSCLITKYNMYPDVFDPVPEDKDQLEILLEEPTKDKHYTVLEDIPLKEQFKICLEYWDSNIDDAEKDKIKENSEVVKQRIRKILKEKNEQFRKMRSLGTDNPEIFSSPLYKFWDAQIEEEDRIMRAMSGITFDYFSKCSFPTLKQYEKDLYRQYTTVKTIRAYEELQKMKQRREYEKAMKTIPSTPLKKELENNQD